MSYKHYTEICSLCGTEHPKRELNKLYISFGHTSVPSPKKICSICDDCLPRLCEVLEISLPDDTVHFRGRAESDTNSEEKVNGLIKPQPRECVPLSECYNYMCCINCEHFSMSGMSAPDGECHKFRRKTDASRHCKGFVRKGGAE